MHIPIWRNATNLCTNRGCNELQQSAVANQNEVFPEYTDLAEPSVPTMQQPPGLADS